jgi:hypothetical protein
MFWDYLFPIFKSQASSWTAGPSKMGPVGNPKTLVQTTLCHAITQKMEEFSLTMVEA